MKFNVYQSYETRFKFTNVEADTPEAAAEKAADALKNIGTRQLRFLKDGMTVENEEWIRGTPLATVLDSVLADGAVDYEKTVHLGPDNEPLVDGKTAVERKAANADRANRFMREILTRYESFTQIIEPHGSWTVSHLIWLHLAILNGRKLDFPSEDFEVFKVVDSLPSAAEWRECFNITGPDPDDEIDWDGFVKMNRNHGD